MLSAAELACLVSGFWRGSPGAWEWAVGRWGEERDVPFFAALFLGHLGFPVLRLRNLIIAQRLTHCSELSVRGYDPGSFPHSLSASSLVQRVRFEFDCRVHPHLPDVSGHYLAAKDPGSLEIQSHANVA